MKSRDGGRVQSAGQESRKPKPTTSITEVDNFKQTDGEKGEQRGGGGENLGYFFHNLGAGCGKRESCS